MSVTDFFLAKILENFQYEPTSCQEGLFKALSGFTMVPEESDIMVINGYAGTGKTSAISAYVKALGSFSIPFKLMAPTGRAAKVLSGYTKERSTTIHKHIYRQKSLSQEGLGQFSLDFNKSKGTVYIVDESSLINTNSEGSYFGTGNLLNDLIDFIRSGDDNKLILIGDDAQLPPVMMDRSPALDVSYLSQYGTIHSVELRSVVRQAQESGILVNATKIRQAIENYSPTQVPKFKIDGYDDVFRIDGGDLIESISEAIDRDGIDEIVVLCRSNKRANRYNAGIRSSILYREEMLNRGDKVMVVKNCYNFKKEGYKEDTFEFIANGDVAEILKISKYEQRYGLQFAEAVLSFPDYNDIEVTAKIILDTLTSETASLSREQQQMLYEGVYADYSTIQSKRKINAKVKEDKYYSALQIKYATAITCHKSQGGQWNTVFIDNAFWKNDVTLDDLKWLYTAVTRAVKKLYFVNFNEKFYE